MCALDAPTTCAYNPECFILKRLLPSVTMVPCYFIGCYSSLVLPPNLQLFQLAQVVVSPKIQPGRACGSSSFLLDPSSIGLPPPSFCPSLQLALVRPATGTSHLFILYLILCVSARIVLFDGCNSQRAV